MFATAIIILIILSLVALWKAIGRAVTDMETRQIARDCRISFRDGGRYMGSDRR